ncbi:alpha/beta fold hydrolase [Curtobacterium sp. MCBD17_023]|uniref:alpha/beta fold hydrolase n=1 Tax=Curtobacterium sp. MCBD17_023 TaxID=2175657 RepID=UPI000D9E6D1A|nr:alpha/beta fold hydrolase [Curtobacterium sp. MCBD17_023]PYY47506.1 alpha/beta hydrolase [Curtobacterium sp. MCBD17_023]
MRLHVERTGRGPRVAVLLHGMTGSAESWWRIAPLLSARGFRVLAVDLPGHGRSPRCSSMSVEDVAEAVAETLMAGSATCPALAVGHSFGGLVLAAAVARGQLAPEGSVFVDSPFSTRGGWDREEVQAEYEQERAQRTYEGLLATKPHYSRRDCDVEARAAARFEPATAAGIAASAGGSWFPAPRSIVVRAEPSEYVDGPMVAALLDADVQVRSITGASHAVWYSHFDEFVAALPEVFG